MLLKTRFLHNILILLCLVSTAFCYAQNKTVFITTTEEKEKEKEVFDGKLFFAQAGVSLAIQRNPDQGTINAFTDEPNSRLLPDGLSGFGTVGMHYKNWVGLGASTGIDYRLTPKLVSVPVYGSVLFTPQWGGDSSILLEVGYGRAFAIGRGNLSGEYTKIRAGVLIENYIGLFIDISQFGYSFGDYRQIGSISIGGSIFSF